MACDMIPATLSGVGDLCAHLAVPLKIWVIQFLERAPGKWALGNLPTAAGTAPRLPPASHAQRALPTPSALTVQNREVGRSGASATDQAGAPSWRQ